MPSYNILTLIDITRSNTGSNETDRTKIAQQSNFNSLIQAIGLRANVSWNRDPNKTVGSLPLPFEGKAAFWTWEFFVERDDVFLKGDDPVGLLIDDLDDVPIILRLEDTANINTPVFRTKGNDVNTLVKII